MYEIHIPINKLNKVEIEYLKHNPYFLKSIIETIYHGRFYDFNVDVNLTETTIDIKSDRDIIQKWREEYYAVTGNSSSNSPEIANSFFISKIQYELSKVDLSGYEFICENNKDDLNIEMINTLKNTNKLLEETIKTLRGERNENI